MRLCCKVRKAPTARRTLGRDVDMRLGEVWVGTAGIVLCVGGKQSAHVLKRVFEIDVCDKDKYVSAERHFSDRQA
jgi:hypothetical protein